MRKLVRSLIAIAGTCLLPIATAEARRVALVVGNSAYVHAPELENPKNDAADMITALKALGFEVVDGLDLHKTAFERKIRDFAKALSGAEVGVFFYAGHGLQVAGQNYLVPVDAELTTASAIDFEMIRLDLVHRMMERETSTNILFLDACRNNRLARNLGRAMGTRSTEIGSGLAEIKAGVGTLISFSTQPGNVALDGASGRNSPFAGALIKHLRQSGDDLSGMLIAVRNDVMGATDDKQVPWEHSALRGRFWFKWPPAVAPLPGLAVRPGQLSKHFTPDDMQRIKTLAAQKDIPLPPTVEVIQPIDDTPEVGRKFIGVWISESGYDTSGRQYAIILTQVIAEGSADMRVIGNTCVGPPTSISPTTIPARCLPLIARIVDGKMTFKNALFETTGTLDLRHHLALEEVWTNGGRARVSLKPVWTLLEAERNANK